MRRMMSLFFPHAALRQVQHGANARRAGLTLVEMLVGMAITLVMMAAVVTLFANISGSVRDRRANVELSGQLRQARNRLARDLAGATCRPTPSQDPEKAVKPEPGVGYLEIIEGQWSDSVPSYISLDLQTSIIPSSQLVLAGDVTDGRGLGDYDDILALTVRSDGEPFVGRGPGGAIIESQLAEVIWCSVENPDSEALGEPGLRTVYRRVLLIAPWLPPIPKNGGQPDDPSALLQEIDISVHFEPPSGTAHTANGPGQWVPNTLSDLTKRENRSFRLADSTFPHHFASDGAGYTNAPSVQVIRNPSDDSTIPDSNASINAVINTEGNVVGYDIAPGDGGLYDAMPIIQVGGAATARPVMQQVTSSPSNWRIAHVVPGPAPLAFDRLGEDLMLSDVLAWDIRVFDPGAPLVEANGTVLEPSDAGWNPSSYGIVGFGAYVGLGWDPSNTTFTGGTMPRYIYNYTAPPPNTPAPLFKEPHSPGWRAFASGNPSTYVDAATYDYPAVYDSWSFHYENDGLDQDFGTTVGGPPPWRDTVDQGTNGLDDNAINGVDDVGEQETSPPYPVPLRGVKIILRSYERDAKQIRETSVTHSFVD